MTSENPSDDGTGLEPLEVDLRLTPDGDVACPLVDTDEDVETARIHPLGETCRVDVVPTDGDTPERETGTVEEECFCRVFAAADCVPTVERVEDGTILLRTYVGDRETVRALVSGLREAVGHVDLDRLAVADVPDGPSGVDVGDVSLTTKQREALELAVVHGYYDGEVDLGTLAEELDISKSAFSQRLRGAQAKLARASVDT